MSLSRYVLMALLLRAYREWAWGLRSGGVGSLEIDMVFVLGIGG